MAVKQKDYYSTREAAELLGVAVSTVQLWTDSGLLSAWTTGGGHRRIERSSVENMLLKKKTVSPKDKNKQTFSIVVVEDNAQQCRLYEKQISAWKLNSSLVFAKDGYEGLLKIGQVQPDVIITDLKMPKMDGFEMIKAVKEIPELSDSLIIAASGLTEDEVNHKGSLPAGVHLFVKPITFEELELLIRKTIMLKAA